MLHFPDNARKFLSYQQLSRHIPSSPSRITHSNSHRWSKSAVSRLFISFQTTILPLSLPVYQSLCFSANSLGGSDTPWLDQIWDQLYGLNSSRTHLYQHHSYLSSHSGPSPSSLPLLCSTSGLPLHRCSLSPRAVLSLSLSLSLLPRSLCKGLQVAVTGWVSNQGKLGKSSFP